VSHTAPVVENRRSTAPRLVNSQLGAFQYYYGLMHISVNEQREHLRAQLQDIHQQTICSYSERCIAIPTPVESFSNTNYVAVIQCVCLQILDSGHTSVSFIKDFYK